jgi:hypothetical protein
MSSFSHLSIPCAILYSSHVLSWILSKNTFVVLSSLSVMRFILLLLMADNVYCDVICGN